MKNQQIKTQSNVDTVMRHASVHWTHAQHKYFKKMKIDKHARRWTAQVPQQLFHIAWDLWKDRNDINHSTAAEAERREMRQLDQEIDEI